MNLLMAAVCLFIQYFNIYLSVRLLSAAARFCFMLIDLFYFIEACWLLFNSCLIETFIVIYNYFMRCRFYPQRLIVTVLLAGTFA